MYSSKAVLLTHDREFIHLCKNAGDKLDMKIEVLSDMVSFLLNLQDNDYRVMIIDCSQMDQTSLKWIRVAKKIRPKVSLIIYCHTVNQKLGGEIYDSGAFYICESPVDQKLFQSILMAAKNAQITTINNHIDFTDKSSKQL
ncbi:MAG: hypothetical protein E4H13_06200 [Calditrichales bacterium]|nr:MAG: hypothetical protein E4H13_06200 [Calditrichales bacterium]